VEVKRRQNESTGAMLRRFSRLVQQSGYLRNAERNQYRHRKDNERKEKNRAIMREQLRGLRKKLDKLGEYSEETFKKEKLKLKQELGL